MSVESLVEIEFGGELGGAIAGGLLGWAFTGPIWVWPLCGPMAFFVIAGIVEDLRVRRVSTSMLALIAATMVVWL